MFLCASMPFNYTCIPYERLDKGPRVKPVNGVKRLTLNKFKLKKSKSSNIQLFSLGFHKINVICIYKYKNNLIRILLKRAHLSKTI